MPAHYPPEKLMDFLDDLNPQQRQAAEASDGPVLVLAGPGSGKTRVLTHRVAYLVQARGIAPRNIMAVTFTNKAAREMRERLEKLLGVSESKELTLGTFHAICARFLRREAPRLDLVREFAIYDADDQLSLVKQALKDLNLDDKKYRPTTLQNKISQAKSELVTPELLQPQTYNDEITRRVYERYQALLRENNALDFDDLLMQMVILFDQNPTVLRHYQNRYEHILVDEFQDTNTAQYALVKQLAGARRNVFCVGDEDQSIYKWRGADFRNVQRFRDQYPDALVILLEQNYRSTQTILDAAQQVIARNVHRTPKKLFTRLGQGVPITIHEAYNEDDEAQYVIDTINALARKGQAKAGDCAIMYRTNAQSRAVEDAFVRAGMPYRLVGATRFYARREIKDVLAYLHLVHNPHNSVALARIINVPSRGIGAKTLAALDRVARDEGKSPYQLIKELSVKGKGAPNALVAQLTPRAAQSLGQFASLIDGWIARRGKLDVGSLLDLVVAESGYGRYVNDGTEEGRERWENVQELRGVASDYTRAIGEDPLTAFLEDVSLVSDTDTRDDEADAPTLMTLHSAKGLEFPIVMIVGMEEGVLPHSRSFDDPDSMEEERRLCYVGMTRAKKRLFLSYAFRRTVWGDSDVREPSRFLADIPDALIEGAAPKAGSSASRAVRWEPALPAVKHKPRELQFRPGLRVKHTRFGEGVVIESKPDGSDEEVTIAFKKSGIKRVLASFANLEKLAG
jgi:DNA helicase-2/ATP-dependent DNA helicase PcrA